MVVPVGSSEDHLHLGGRLVIKEVSVENFKSYAGKHIIGPFHPSFTAIVGPNGSGKSNLIDALLFVFGYKAKKMRQGKLCDLIHVSEQHPSTLSSCSVTVRFGISHNQPAPNSENNLKTTDLNITDDISVKRVVWKNNKSEYFVNDMPSNFTEIIALLKSKGIDLEHKRFLILQGEVESISLMKPKATTEYDEGLLEYLEDLIGTSAYVPLIEESAQKHEKLLLAENDAFSKLKFLQKEKEDCEVAKNSVSQLINNENEHLQNHALLLQLEAFEARQHLHQAKSEILQSEEKISKAKEKCLAEISSFGDMEIDISGLEKDLAKKQSALAEIKKDLDAKQKIFIGKTEEKKQMKQNLKKNQKALEEEKTTQSNAAASIGHLTEEIQLKSKAIKETEAALVEAKKTLKSIQESISTQIASLQQTSDALSVESLPLKNKSSLLEKTIETTSVELENLQHEKQKFDTSLEALNSKIAAIKGDIEEKLTENESLSAHLGALEDKISSASQEQSLLNEKVISLREKVLLLQEKYESAAPKTPQNSLLKLFFEGGVDGVHGRLGDLGSIDDRFTVAASIAAGYSLENIVVESTNTAQSCVEILKQKRAGRATFIILDKIKKYTPAASNEFPGTRVVDLITTEDARYQDAFYHALKDTLVADSLSDANKLAYGKKRFRVVTVDGKLIDLSGTMSGGGSRGDMPVHRIGINKSKKGSACASAIKEMENELLGAENELKGLNKALDEACAQHDQFLSLKDEVHVAIRKNQNTILSCEKALKSLECQLEDQKNQQKKAGEAMKRLPALEFQITTDKQALQQTLTQIQEFNDKIQNIQNQILDIGGIEYRTAYSSVQTLTEQYEHLQTRLIKAQTEMTLGERKLARSKVDELEKTCATISKGIDKCDSESESLQHEIEKLTQKHETISESLLELRSVIKSQKEMSQRINILRANLNDLESDTKKEIAAVEKRANSLSLKIENCKSKIDCLQFISIENNEDDDVFEQRNAEVVYYDDDDLKGLLQKKDQLMQRINAREIQNNSKNTPINLHVYEEFKQKNALYLNAKTQYEVARDTREETKQLHDTLKKKRHDEFMAGFSSISSRLKEIYQLITMGGNAELELVDSLDPFSEGVIFSVMPPKKTWKNIAHLSGGEKTLSSLALIFALHTYKPTPFYIMDEIDAALDFKNVSIIANYIRERTASNAQFVVISLRNDMFERADRLVGVFKTNNCSQSVRCPPIK